MHTITMYQSQIDGSIHRTKDELKRHINNSIAKVISLSAVSLDLSTSKPSEIAEKLEKHRENIELFYALLDELESIDN